MSDLEREVVALKRTVECMAETYDRQVTELREMIHERAAAFERRLSGMTETESGESGTGTEDGAAVLEEMLESAIRRRNTYAGYVRDSCERLVEATTGFAATCAAQVPSEKNLYPDSLEEVQEATVNLDRRYSELLSWVARVGTLRHALGRIGSS